MRTERIGLLTLALTLVLAPAAANAGGPLLVFDPETNTPYAWDTAAPVNVYTDLGDLGPVTNAQADALVQTGASEWSGVATSGLQLNVAGDFSTVGLPDVNNGSTAAGVIGTFNGGGIHVIYDDDENVFFEFFGIPPGSGVLGIASPDFADGSEITEGWVVLGGGGIDPSDTAGLNFGGVVTHEFGHSINLAHTQTNGAIIYLGDQVTPDGCAGPYSGLPTLADIETMYPFIDPSAGSGIGLEVATIEHPDDVSALSNLYAAGGWPTTGATISGQVLLPDGVTPVTGINVIVRNVNDPFGDSNSELSGNRSQGDASTPRGDFEFNGLTPGEEYVVYIDGIVDGGFSTPPTTITFDEEWWNTAESADGTVDPECDVSGIVANGVTSNVDIILTDPGAVLPLGDDDAIEVPLGFEFPFCDGNTYSSVFVGSNGFLTFGQGDTDFSESVGELLDGPPRIAPLWDDLAPNSAGTVTAENVGGEFVVTFTDVPQFAGTDSNNFTVTLRPDGSYTIEYGAIATTDAIVGRSEGGGVADPGSTDLSAAAQPIGDGLQTVYEEFSFVPSIDLANGTFEWTICELLPPAILDVDTTPIEVTLPAGGTTQLPLAISNAAVPPAFDLEWTLDDVEVTASPFLVRTTTELFEPQTAFRLERPSQRSGAATKKPTTADALKDVSENMPHVHPQHLAKALGPNAVADGSFEAGPFGGVWNESSTNFGTPICDVVTCGTGTGTGPRTGSFWTWFGGIAAFEAGSVSQTVTIPTGDVTLSFWLEQIVCDSPSDYMQVLIDGTEVFRTDGGSALCGQLGYTEITVDLTALGFADGQPHDVEFRSEIFAANGGGTNFFVDDVVIAAEIADCGFLSASATTGTIPAGDSDIVDLVFDATGLATGSYDCEVSISSNGGSATIPVTLNVTGDDVPPTAACNPWVTIVNETETGPCEAFVDPSQVDAGSFDPDGGDVTLALDPPGPYVGGQNPVTLIVTDDEGNVSTCESVIVVDCPVPVSFTDVSVAREGWGAVLQWRLAEAYGFTGYHVYRQNGEQTDRVRLTDQVQDLSVAGSFRFVDEVAPTGSATYTVELVNANGGTMAFGPFRLTEGSGDDSIIRLEGGSPNPFRGQTTISFAVRSQQAVNLSVFDLRGRRVATLVDGVKGAGQYDVSWDGRTDSGADVGSGVYLMRLQAQDQVEVQKVMLTK